VTEEANVDVDAELTAKKKLLKAKKRNAPLSRPSGAL